MSERTDSGPRSAATVPPIDLLGVDHPAIMATTVCSIVEHGGELLMVRQLNREGEERSNSPDGWSRWTRTATCSSRSTRSTAIC